MNVAIDPAAFVAGLERMMSELPEVHAAYSAAVADDGYRSLVSTSTFQNRTYALREAFSQSGDQNERRVYIDPSAGPRRGKTPPATYGAYLNYGTRSIAPRRLLETAREAIETSAIGSADVHFGGWIRRGGG